MQLPDCLAEAIEFALEVGGVVGPLVGRTVEGPRAAYTYCSKLVSETYKDRGEDVEALPVE